MRGEYVGGGRTLRRLVGVAGVALALAVCGTAAVSAPPAAGTTLQRLSVAQLSRRAVSVAQGEVVATKVRTGPGDLRTAVRLRVSRTLKGAQRRFLTVFVPGGQLTDGRSVVVAGMPSFSVGDRCVVFVDVRGWVVGGFQGQVELDGSRVEGTDESTAAFGRRVKAALGVEPASADAPTPESAAPVTSSAGTGRALTAVTITGITPASAPAGTDSIVTISGSGFGTAPGAVNFSYGRNGLMQIASRSIRSWTDTSISCTVPTALIENYAASAGTGPVAVVTAGNSVSNQYQFSVPFGYGGASWPSSQVTFRVNTSGVDDALRSSLVSAGAAAWNAVGSGFTFIDEGPTGSGLAADGMNVVSWADGLPTGVLAMSYSDSLGGTMYEVDVQFSNAYPWGDGTPGTGTYDVQSITTHELGHWLMLLDQYMPGDKPKVMYGYGGKDEQKRTPTADDVAGILWVYPGAGSTPTPTATPTPTVTPTPTSTPTISPTPTPSPTSSDLGPVCRVKNATVKRGGIVRIRYMVTDNLDLIVQRSISIRTKAEAVKRKWTGVAKSSTTWQSFRFKCDLRKGTYGILVKAQDLAGHPASVVGSGTLVVR